MSTDRRRELLLLADEDARADAPLRAYHPTPELRDLCADEGRIYLDYYDLCYAAASDALRYQRHRKHRMRHVPGRSRRYRKGVAA